MVFGLRKPSRSYATKSVSAYLTATGYPTGIDQSLQDTRERHRDYDHDSRSHARGHHRHQSSQSQSGRRSRRYSYSSESDLSTSDQDEIQRRKSRRRRRRRDYSDDEDDESEEERPRRSKSTHKSNRSAAPVELEKPAGSGDEQDVAAETGLDTEQVAVDASEPKEQATATADIANDLQQVAISGVVPYPPNTAPLDEPVVSQQDTTLKRDRSLINHHKSVTVKGSDVEVGGLGRKYVDVEDLRVPVSPDGKKRTEHHVPASPVEVRLSWNAPCIEQLTE